MSHLEELKKAAKCGKWDYVDSTIPKIAAEIVYAEWAYNEGIRDTDGNVRDLAVSIIEKSDIPESRFSEMRDGLYELMENDENPYVRYRSAFALARHGPGRHKMKVLEKLTQATQDKDVSELAKNFIEGI
jgi:hypothetical protein